MQPPPNNPDAEVVVHLCGLGLLTTKSIIQLEILGASLPVGEPDGDILGEMVVGVAEGEPVCMPKWQPNIDTTNSRFVNAVWVKSCFLGTILIDTFRMATISLIS